MQTLDSELDRLIRSPARWLAFLHALGLPWCRPPGMDAADFYVPYLGTVFKVGGDPDDDRLRDLARRHRVGPLPTDIPEPGLLPLDGSDVASSGFPVLLPGGIGDTGYAFCECPKCGLVGVEYEGRTARLPCQHVGGDDARNADSPWLLAAYSKARSLFAPRNGRAAGHEPLTYSDDRRRIGFLTGRPLPTSLSPPA